MRVATEKDLPPIGETLARAFERDPVWGWALEPEEDPARKLTALRAILGFSAVVLIGRGWVRVTGDCEAVALWIPPGEEEMSAADEERYVALVKEECGPDSAARVLDLTEAFAGVHPDEPPHFHLILLGTHPDHAGSGLGLGLLAECLEEIDSLGAPAFLDSPDPATARRYERHGFRPTAQADLVGGLTTTLMWRAPRGIGPGS